MLFPQTEQYNLALRATALPVPRDLLDGANDATVAEELRSYLTSSFTDPLPTPNQFDSDLISTLPLTPDDPIEPDGSSAPTSDRPGGFSIAPSDDPFKPYRAIDPRRFQALADKLSPGIEELAKYGSSALTSNPLGLTSRQIIQQLLRSK